MSSSPSYSRKSTSPATNLDLWHIVRAWLLRKARARHYLEDIYLAVYPGFYNVAMNTRANQLERLGRGFVVVVVVLVSCAKVGQARAVDIRQRWA